MELGETRDVAVNNENDEKMLGITWNPFKDVFQFSVKINLSPLKNKSRTGSDLTREQLLNSPPTTITRREYYSQIQSLFDPIGLLAPVLLRAKILLRMTWEGECGHLKWDDPLPVDLVKLVLEFFTELYDLEHLEFSRSLWPQVKTAGLPELVIFSDGSVLAFGAAAYIRWRLESGK